MWRCFVRDQARVPSVAGAGSSLFRNRNSFSQTVPTRWIDNTDHDSRYIVPDHVTFCVSCSLLPAEASGRWCLPSE